MRGPAEPALPLPGGQPEVPRAGPGEVSRTLFPGAEGVWPGASLGSEILTKPVSCLPTALSHCPGRLQPQPRSGWARQTLEQKSPPPATRCCRAGQRCKVTSTPAHGATAPALRSHQLITSPRLWHPAKAGCIGPSRVARGLGRRKTPEELQDL